VGVAFNCIVTATIHNNGAVTPVDIIVDFELAVPFDCDKTPDEEGPDQSESTTLASSVETTVVKTWSVTCDDYSNHTFTGQASIESDQLHVRDAITGNNSGNSPDNIPVFAYTDVKTPDVVLTYPAQVDVDEEFEIKVKVVIHNNGPVSPLDGEGGLGLALPPDCIKTPNSFQLFNPVSLPASVTVEVERTWTVTCSSPGTHQAIGCGRAGPVTQHVREISTNNAHANEHFTIVVGQTEPAVHAGISCSILGDPPEECGNGVDEDLDGLIDEEPDVDHDGLSDCVDSDDDGDGYPDSLESRLSTDPWNHCPRHPFDKAWPPDIDNSRTVTIVDVLSIKPVFNTSVGNPNYSVRKDLNGDGSITIVDVLSVKPHFNKSCVNPVS
jgi:hypothetical protein